MTEQTQAAGADAPQPVILDAVTLHFKRQAAYFEQEALMLAITVREQAVALDQAKAHLAALERATHG
jgi:hypothetical protein